MLAHLGAPKTLQTPGFKNGMISGPCDPVEEGNQDEAEKRLVEVNSGQPC